MAASKSGSRKSAAKKAAKARKPKAAAKRAAKTRKPRAAGKKAAVTRKRRAAAKKAPAARQAKPAVVPQAKATVATSEIDGRIAIVRNNLRDLVEQAASFSGAANEELMSQRIAEQEAKLELLKKQREEMLQRGS
jgi:hypothetical protein